MPHTLKKMPTTIGKMIDKKQILHNAPLSSFESGAAKTQQLKRASTTVVDEKKKKSYSGGSMFNFFKQNQAKDSEGIKKELLARSKDTAPMLFRQRKAKI